MLRKGKVTAGLVIMILASIFGLNVSSIHSGQINYPTRPIDLVVSWSPGGSTGSAAGLIAPLLSKKWNQPVNIVYMPGGSGIPGANHVMRAQPDGYTMLTDPHSTNSMLAASRTDLPFKWDNRTPIALLFYEPVNFTVKADAPWKTLKEVVAAIKADPQSFKWGTGSIAGTGNFAMAELFNAAGIDFKSTNRVILSVGGASTLTALAGGHISLAGQQLSEGLSLISGGLIRGLAIVLRERAPQLPDVPTAKEAGFPSLQTIGWNAISGPPNLPQEIVEKWTSALKEIMSDPELIKKAHNLGKIPTYVGPSEFKKFMYDQYNLYLPLAESTGIRK